METPQPSSSVRIANSDIELRDLSTALQQSQVDAEDGHYALARILHDDLGGLLVGAIMDVGWIANQSALPQNCREKLGRAQGLLRAAIDLKRELIENLRPTLLDNVGLFSTLQWHLKDRCKSAGIAYIADLPPAEHDLSPDVRIAVFRIFQEALTHVLSAYGTGNLALKVEMKEDTLHCDMTHQASRDAAPSADQHRSPKTSMSHRADRVGGTLHWRSSDAGCHMHLAIPTL